MCIRIQVASNKKTKPRLNDSSLRVLRELRDSYRGIYGRVIKTRITGAEVDL